jgi:hypothetical protein
MLWISCQRVRGDPQVQADPNGVRQPLVNIKNRCGAPPGP